MKKLFISQPMREKSDEEIMAVRQVAIRKAVELVGEDVEVIDTFYTDFKASAKPLEYIGRSISDMAKADIVYFAKGWQDMRGCKIEHMCAVEYGLNILEDECGRSSFSLECELTFGQAIELAKQGKRITRRGWNGKGMFVVYQKGYPQGIPCNKHTAEAFGYQEGDLFVCRPYLQMRCADGTHQMWLASQSDILADDWEVVG